jgi:hypothetical protein
METGKSLVHVDNYCTLNHLHSLKTTKMEIKELKYEVRLGNYVYINDKITKLECLDIDIYDQNYPTDSAKPIPLTEELLLMCGAKETESYTYEFTQIGKDIDLCVKFCELDICVTIWQGDPIYLRYDFVDFYLHNLQNLYHSLCGEELTYNHSPSI